VGSYVTTSGLLGGKKDKLEKTIFDDYSTRRLNAWLGCTHLQTSSSISFRAKTAKIAVCER